MKKLLSLPPNLVDKFHEITKLDEQEWFCTSDPIEARLGSGGGTLWLLDECKEKEQSDSTFGDWLKKEKRILFHAGGQSRRLPSYAPSGKILAPIPVFRWARGQKLSQTLLSLQTPLYEEIMRKAPDSLHTLIASGDVYLRKTEALQDIPEADIVCYGLWVDPTLATNHGVFVMDRHTPEKLDHMLQKPSLEKLGQLSSTHLFLMDIGVWLLSDRAVELLKKHSFDESSKSYKEYDLYGEFGLALGNNPVIKDNELKELTVAILPLPGGEFYHFGTSRELISSTLALQNVVTDQRAIMQHKIKPHPAMFVQNSEVNCLLTNANSELWIENSVIGKSWQISNRHIITGVPQNDWTIKMPPGACLDVVPINDTCFVARPYGFNDPFKGEVDRVDTLYLGKSLQEWASERGINITTTEDIQNCRIFPICSSIDQLEKVLRWMISEPALSEGYEIWEKAEKLSANEISDKANLKRLFAHREALKVINWPKLASNHNKSIFYQLDLYDAAQEYYSAGIELPEELSESESVMKRVRDHMFRSKVMKLRGDLKSSEEEKKAFGLLREELIQTVRADKQSPVRSVYPDQIVWSRSPVRVDLAGGWTDTPPYCMYAGGNVVNMAIELNGQPPLQVYVKPTREYHIIMRSIDMGKMECISTWDELRDFRKIGSPFSIPKAALALVGFVPEFCATSYSSLEEHLKAFGGGLEVTLLAAIPAGSGLGTSSILAATVLGALSDFCGLAWDKSTIANRTLILEQLLTTGGGWQDQYGGIFQGIKLLQTNESIVQSPSIRWLPEYLLTDSAYKPCHLLFYTGITRTAKDILAEIVRGMFLNSSKHLELLNEMKLHALEMNEAILRGDFETYGRLIKKTWEQNKNLDSGTNPQAVERLIAEIEDYAYGYKLPGAGGGGYLYIVAKDPEAALHIRHRLINASSNTNARFVEMNLSEKGLQTSRS